LPRCGGAEAQVLGEGKHSQEKYRRDDKIQPIDAKGVQLLSAEDVMLLEYPS
jgi:hypothetical protein